MTELKRDIYAELLKWKERDNGKVLILKGARQVGKTYILDKFAKENYRQYIYINMAHISGQEFLKCLDQATLWQLGMPRPDKPLHKAFCLFENKFTDGKETVVVIDEIQESSRVYSLIRQFAREFQCHFIVTGSYLGKTVEQGYFLPAGDTEELRMDTLSFLEFLEAIGVRQLYESIDLYGEDVHDHYATLKKWYQVYCIIGGYPAVIKRYLETGDMKACKDELYQIIRSFMEELPCYFGSIMDVNLLDQLFPAIVQLSAKESKKGSSLDTELSNRIYGEENNFTVIQHMKQVIAWLCRLDIIGYCGMAFECDPTDVAYNVRIYFRDLGVARYFLKRAVIRGRVAEGYINKNFVYINLMKRIERMEIGGTSPVFGTYKDGEIDFLVSSLQSEHDYGIEVNVEKNEAGIAGKLLEDGKAEAVYFLNEDTYGGIEDRRITVPIYLIGRVQFD